MRPLASVVFATHNRARMLPALLHSLSAQCCQVPFEVLAVDNASTDGSRRVLEKHAGADDRLKVLVEPRPGKNRALNRAAEFAAGRLLLFTDDDVVADPGWVQGYVSFFERAQRDLLLAGGAILPAPEDLGEWPAWLLPDAVEDVPTQLHLGSRGRLEHDFEYVWGANLAMTADTLAVVGPWDETIGPRGEYAGGFPRAVHVRNADVDYNRRVRECGGQVWFVPDAIVRHRVRRGEVTPQRLLKTALSRGRQEHAYSSRYDWPETRPETVRLMQRAGSQGVLPLATQLVRLLVGAAVFRVTNRASAYEYARRAAWRSGWLLQSLKDRPTYPTLEATVMTARGAAVRLVGTESRDPSGRTGAFG